MHDMLSTEIFTLPVHEINKKLKSGEVTSVQLTETLINYAKRINEITNAYISFREPEALKEAEEADKAFKEGRNKGVYWGIPMGIKDNIFIKDETTTMGSEIHRNYIPEQDAAVYKKLREAGIIVIGKLNLHEYAWGVTNDNPHFGTTHNPWNLNKITGGSSGGSGAAIASGASYASIGTDTAGSVRIPASCCGIVGLKPTQELINRDGVFPLSHSLDHVGPMGRNVDDVVALLQVVIDDKYVDKLQQSAKNKTSLDEYQIGINKDYYMHELDSNVEEIMNNQIQKLKDKGAHFKEVKIPTLQMVAFMGYMTILSESFTIHDENLQNRIEDFGPDVQGLYQQMGSPSAVDYLKAQSMARQLQLEFSTIFSEVDVLLTPALPVLPPDIGSPTVQLNGKEVDLNDHIMRFMFPGNITGLPSLVMPGGVADGLPVGLQVIGPQYGDLTVLQFSKALEELIDFDYLGGMRQYIDK